MNSRVAISQEVIIIISWYVPHSIGFSITFYLQYAFWMETDHTTLGKLWAVGTRARLFFRTVANTRTEFFPTCHCASFARVCARAFAVQPINFFVLGCVTQWLMGINRKTYSCKNPWGRRNWSWPGALWTERGTDRKTGRGWCVVLEKRNDWQPPDLAEGTANEHMDLRLPCASERRPSFNPLSSRGREPQNGAGRPVGQTSSSWQIGQLFSHLFWNPNRHGKVKSIFPSTLSLFFSSSSLYSYFTMSAGSPETCYYVTFLSEFPRWIFSSPVLLILLILDYS